jgi:hypothetical protein
MPTFTLNQCSIDLSVEPLGGALAAQDRQLAWSFYLALVTRYGLRDGDVSPQDLRALIDSMQAMLQRWPAGEIASPRPGHLGFLMVAIIEVVLLPCLQHGASEETGKAVYEFCRSLAREIAKVYGLPDAGANVPQDMLDAWRSCS